MVDKYQKNGVIMNWKSMARQEEEVWERLWEHCNTQGHDCRKATLHLYEAEAKTSLTIDVNSTSDIEFLLRYFKCLLEIPRVK